MRRSDGCLAAGRRRKAVAEGISLNRRGEATMLDHVSLGVSDLARSRRFYDAALRPLGLLRIVNFEGRGSDYGAVPGSLGVEFTITVERIAAPSLGMHLCFRAPNREA